jgi:intergrase/recombinase
MDKKAINALKNKLIRETKMRVQMANVTKVDQATVSDCEQRWASLLNNRIQPDYLRQVNLKDFLPESIFLQRFYPYMAHLGRWTCSKTRQRVKAREHLFQVLTSFEIISKEFSESLFPALAQLRTENVNDLAMLYCFFDTNERPLTIT